ncbi:class I SAM-dependent methyltransferase [Mycobacterium sp. 1274756.6]|uniref:class I SAM-dependent methyltransferase n=1 Tax=Mycobacterium sp. 1274756.6 TaxID=1834076 RepID=UPI0009EDC0B3|nr:class I SAM-dependent methyltransferase [Mycobacterium sp. 1274756.6]
MSAATKHITALTGISETALLTLNGRVRETRRENTVLDDPVAVQVADSLDFPFRQFGRPRQGAALRALAFDNHTAAYLQRCPSATVVALGEGLQTSFWRLDADIPDGAFRWVTVDLPPVIDLRARLLPQSPRITMCAQSALDYSWMDQVDPAGGVFITAEGLFMHLRREQVLDLIAECARRFPGACLLFDLIPAWAVAVSRRRGLRVARHYRTPPLKFGASTSELRALLTALPGVRTVQNPPYPPGRGWLLNRATSLTYRLPGGDRLRNILTLVEFAEP